MIHEVDRCGICKNADIGTETIQVLPPYVILWCPVCGSIYDGLEDGSDEWKAINP